MPRSASASKIPRAAAWAGLVWAGLGLAAFASGRTTPPAERIAAVAVLVDGRPADADFVQLVPLRAGQDFSPRIADEALRQLYRTGLFADIRILRREEEGLSLTVELERRLTVRDVTFRGGEGPAARLPREKVFSIRAGAAYTESKRSRAENEIREALRREGYLSCVVISSVRRVEGHPAMDVLFEVDLGARFTVREISFKGRPILPPAELQALLTTGPGQPYNPALLEEDTARLKSAYRALGYPRADVAVRGRVFHEADQTVSLSYFVVPGDRVVIEAVGAKVDTAPLREIWEQDVFEDWAVSRSEARILAEMRSRGYVLAAVTSRLERSPDALRVVHAVEPGVKLRLRDVLFEGVRHFTPDELRRELGIGPRLPVVAVLNGSEAYALPERVAALYQARGFPEARAELGFRPDGLAADVVLTVTEGPRRTIGRVSITGAALFPTADLLAHIASKPGAAFTSTAVQRDVGRLESYYADRGVRETKIAAAVSRSSENVYGLEFRIVEGRRFRVDRIVVTGSPLTRRRLIDRQMRIREGDWAGAEAIQESRRSLEQLGVFSEVRIEEVPTGPEAVNLIVSLREGQRNQISLGAGLETKNEPVTLDLGENVIGPRATAEYIRGNVFGRAAQFSLVGQFSAREKRAVASWEEPYLFGWPVPVALNGWIEREDRESYGFDRRGISLTATRPLASGWTSLTTLRWASTTLYFLEIEENEVDRQHFPFSATSVSETFLLDKRDDSFNPERGFFFSAALDWAYPLFRAESDYIKTFIKYQVYKPVFGRWSLSLTGRGGLAMGRMPIHERFFAGGSNSFRGRSFDRLGPKDARSDMPVGGKAILVINAELAFPLLASLPDLSGAFFYDVGNVFLHRGDFSLSGLENAVGFGLRYRTPLGPIRFDLGWNLNAPKDQRQPLAFITIGNVF